MLDVVVGLLRDSVGVPTLYVFAGNGRGRRFYEKHGWIPTGVTKPGGFPPAPLLLEYTLPGHFAQADTTPSPRPT